MKAIIMAGGKGTRLMPLTGKMPKPMVNLLDKPVLCYTLALLRKHGVTDIGVTVGYMADKIESYFGDGEDFGVRLTYFEEETPLGTAGGVRRAEDFLDEDFFVLSGDAYTEIDLSRAAAFHKAKRSPFTVVCQPRTDPTGLGTLNIDFENRITDFVEKPQEKKPGLVNTGIYVVNKGVLRLIPSGFYDFGRDLLPRIYDRCFAYVDYSYWSDIGTLDSYYDTNKYLASKWRDDVVVP